MQERQSVRLLSRISSLANINFSIHRQGVRTYIHSLHLRVLNSQPSGSSLQASLMSSTSLRWEQSPLVSAWSPTSSPHSRSHSSSTNCARDTISTRRVQPIYPRPNYWQVGLFGEQPRPLRFQHGGVHMVSLRRYRCLVSSFSWLTSFSSAVSITTLILVCPHPFFAWCIPIDVSSSTTSSPTTSSSSPASSSSANVRSFALSHSDI